MSQGEQKGERQGVSRHVTRSISQRIADVVGSWKGVTVQRKRFGGVEFRVQHREIGHLHGERVADLLFTVRARRMLVAAGRAVPHRVLPNTGWVSHPIRSEHDVPAVLELLRLNYERLLGQPVALSASPITRNTEIIANHAPDDLTA
jgi:hypothetical protein